MAEKTERGGSRSDLEVTDCDRLHLTIFVRLRKWCLNYIEFEVIRRYSALGVAAAQDELRPSDFGWRRVADDVAEELAERQRNILKLIGCGVAEDVAWFAMPLCHHKM